MSSEDICDSFDPDHVFQRFKIVEFPPSFVGLATHRILDVEVDLTKSALLKTSCEGSLLKFKDARDISPSHRAFNIVNVDNHTILITFYPINECICSSKRKNAINRFVFDLRLIQVDGEKCCYDEYHAEIGRYYISGEYEYCKLSHYPKIIDFDCVYINTKVSKYVHIRNESKLIAARFEYIRETGFEVIPQSFEIQPNSTRRLLVTMKPYSLKLGNTLTFQVRNIHEANVDTTMELDDFFISYSIVCKVKPIYGKKPIIKPVESLHKIIEQDVRYAFITEQEKMKNKQIKETTLKYLQMCKSSSEKKPVKEKYCTGTVQCYDEESKIYKNPKDFCKQLQRRVSTYELIQIMFLPYRIDFGRIALMTYGTQKLTVNNKSLYDISIQLCLNDNVSYTNEKFRTYSLNLKAKEQTTLDIYCLGFADGHFKSVFEYTIDNKFSRKHSYSLQVADPALCLKERILKFGMTTSDTFVTSVPVYIYNNFNIPVKYTWDEISSETPFEVYPSQGVVPDHCCRICDVIYNSRPTKSKVHEIGFTSQNNTMPVELNIMTRKLAIKFLQPSVNFKDIPLNIETTEIIKLENSSREIAVFYIVEPLIPGLTIEPMVGFIRPKMILSFTITVKIACILEFSLDICLKINNKENVILPVSGTVMEPKIVISPKNIFMARIPCSMITYVPLTVTNLSTLKSFVQVLDTGDENIFNVYVAEGNDKIRTFEFTIEPGQSKIVYIKVFDIYRREYDMYIPFKINSLLGPPDENPYSTELQYYIRRHEENYESNLKVKIKSLNRDISFCRIIGVITVPWIEFSVDKFEINYVPNGENKLDFNITNISKYHLFTTIITSKLSPYFVLQCTTEDCLSLVSDSLLKFELPRGSEVSFALKFTAKGHGRFVSTAIMFLDKHMTIPYSNLTFVGKRETPVMTASEYSIVFPPCPVEHELFRQIKVSLKIETDLDSFSCSSKDESCVAIKLLDMESATDDDGEIISTLLVDIKVYSEKSYSRSLTVTFHHSCGSCCNVEIYFNFINCPLTLHTSHIVSIEDNPYPYYPLKKQKKLYDYMTECTSFLEKWMYQQGFRRDLYPVIPDSFYAISSSLTSQPTGAGKVKGINVSYLNFVRRVAGPLIKHVRKITVIGSEVDEEYKPIKEIHDTYREIINLLKCRGANIWLLQAKFLLSYEQFVVYVKNKVPKRDSEILLNRELLADVELFNRISKQCWIDFILQTYKVFIIDSCFFDCVCVSSANRDIVDILIRWYNDNIMLQHTKLRKKGKPVKVITNITTDLADGIAIISTFLTNCPFMSEHFSMFCEAEEGDDMGGIILHNACLIIEAINQLRLYFPICSKDFFEINYLRMLFLSIHLYVTLPMFRPKDTIIFNPPLLRSSTRLVAICPSSQESLTFTFIILNTNRSNFIVEKAPSIDNGKKIYLSIKYTANFVNSEKCILLIHGYNKTRIFDTYIVFLLQGNVGSLNPWRKCKVTGPLYRPHKGDILVASPFTTAAIYKIYLTDAEPTCPVTFQEITKPKFYVQRLNLIEREIHLTALPKETGSEVTEHRLFLQIICLSTQVGTSWIWFRSEVGDFFVKVTTQPRWDLMLDTLQTRIPNWPDESTSCEEHGECYESTSLLVPHRNELMLKSLRHALMENASQTMMNVFDYLIETTSGKMVLAMLLNEVGTNMSDVNHILHNDISYRINFKSLIPNGIERVTMKHHTSAMLNLPVLVPLQEKQEKYSITFTSDCGMDIRTYKVIIVTDVDYMT